MPLSFNDFLKELAKAKPKEPISIKLSADEADNFFEALNGIMSFRRWKDGLIINSVYSLDQSVHPFLNKNIQAFQQRLIRGEVRIAKGPNGDWMPAPADGEPTEIRGKKSNPCSWYWKLKYYWWGVRLGLNHCGAQWVADEALEAVKELGLPWWIALALLEVAVKFKIFDTGCGVRIYLTYAFPTSPVVTTRPHSVGIC